MQKCNYPKQNCRLLKGCSIKKIILQVKLAAKTHKIQATQLLKINSLTA